MEHISGLRLCFTGHTPRHRYGDVKIISCNLASSFKVITKKRVESRDKRSLGVSAEGSRAGDGAVAGAGAASVGLGFSGRVTRRDDAEARVPRLPADGPAAREAAPGGQGPGARMYIRIRREGGAEYSSAYTEHSFVDRNSLEECSTL